MNYKIEFYKATYPNRVLSLTDNNFYKIIKNSLVSLEDKFKKSTNCKFALGISNSSLAIHLSLCAIDLKRGDKVVCAINSFVDIPEAIRHFDSEPIFVDIDANSYHIDINALKKAIKQNKSKKLRAIFITHFAGLKVDLSEILEIAKENNLIVIEDFTDCVASINKNIVAGDIAIFSLNNKLDNSLKGAIVTFKNESHFNRAKLLREHGLVSKSDSVNYLYDVVDIGCNYKLDDLSAYLLEGIFEQRQELVKKRLEIAHYYLKELNGVEHIKLPINSKEHIYSYFIIEIDKNRDYFANELKKLGIETALHFIPLNFTSYYKDKYGLKIFNFPNALNIYPKILSIPCNAKMSLEDAKVVVDAIKEVASKHI